MKSNFRKNQNFSNDFIINEINKSNKQANNVIFYNIQESNSNQSDERLSYDIKQVNSTIASIIVYLGNPPIPLKVIGLGRYQTGKLEKYYSKQKKNLHILIRRLQHIYL